MADFAEISIINAAVRCGIRLADSVRTEMTINCVFCGDRKKRMRINTIKNLFYCHNLNSPLKLAYTQPLREPRFKSLKTAAIRSVAA